MRRGHAVCGGGWVEGGRDMDRRTLARACLPQPGREKSMRSVDFAEIAVTDRQDATTFFVGRIGLFTWQGH